MNTATKNSGIQEEKLKKGWIQTTLGEVVELQNQKILTKELNTSTYISTENLLPNKQGVVNAKKLPNIETVNQFRVGDTLFSNIRTYFKKVWYATRDGGTSNDVLIFRHTDNKILDKKYLFYFISNNKFIDFTVHTAKGTKMPRGDKNAILSLPIHLPPLQEQKSIAETLSAFDDKIELLREQNETLEEIGKTIFKEWFGKYSVDKPEDLPEGWKVGELGDTVQTVLGGTPKTTIPEYWDNGTIPWINSGEINNFRVFAPTTYITELGFKKSAAKLMPKGTTLLAITGATLGQVSLLEIESTGNQSIVGIIPNQTLSKEYVYYCILANIQRLINSATGGAQQHINKNNVNELKIIIPSETILSKFNQTVSTFLDKISTNTSQILSLTQTRDILLKELI